MSIQGKDLSTLSPARRELLALMLKKKGVKTELPRVIPKRGGSGPCPLSFAQERIWFFEQLEPGTAVYNIANAVRLTGQLDLEALRLSLNEVLQRHEVLRTVFASEDDKAVQIVVAAELKELPFEDLSEVDSNERAAEAVRLINEESQRAFDLQRGPLLRCKVLRLAETEHVVVLCTHHIASDGWSMSVLVNEIAALYESFSTGEPATLPELHVQYADFAEWQRQWLQGEVLDEQLAYWKQQLAGAPRALNLTTDRPRPPVQTFCGARESLKLSPSLSNALRDLSRQSGVTMFMLLLAGFKTLLSRYTGQDDIVVGTPIANRSRAEIENLIGFFVNMLVMRTDLSGDPSFAELLVRVRETSMGAYAHQDLPFEKLVQELQPERNLNLSPLFQVLFALHNKPSGTLELAGITFTPWETDRETAKFDLFFGMSDENEGIGMALEYNTDLFDAETIRQLLANFGTLLEGIANDPQKRLSQLPIMTAQERAEILTKWNQTAATYDREVNVATLFELQAARVPDRIAVEFEDRQLTYAELNARSNQLAHYLRRLGVGPETRVGIATERSFEMLIATLAVLKAGGAYVPLDPAFPTERLAYMVEDSQVSVLLLHESTKDKLPSTGATTVLLDTDWKKIAEEKEHNPKSQVTSENLAYVIYTSGSTGKPKGTQIPHGPLVNFLHSMRREPGLTADDTFLAVTTLSFDIAGLELYLPLLAGGRLLLANREQASDGPWLLKKLEGVTVMQATPTTWRLVIAAGWEKSLPVKVLSGGEALSSDLAAQLLERCASLWNMYGPTETTVWSTTHQVEHAEGPAAIGHAIANTQIYLLDNHLEPVSNGVAGQLYIAGDGLSRGYWRRPDLTAERFIPNPFSAVAGARMYLTGDLARYRRDGSIEYLGRVDQQVKVHGHRIEPGEIEVVLAEHPSVREIVVVAVDDPNSDKQLVAYVVSNDGESESEEASRADLVSQLRRYAKEKLPDYLSPSLYVLLEKFPLTPSGKVDRKALPAPDKSRSESLQPYVSPRNETEKALAAVWSEVLGVKQVGVYDNFFELGGDSILGIQMIARANRAGLSYKPKQLFQYQTVASLAAATVDAVLVAQERSTPISSDDAKKAMAQLEREGVNEAAIESVYALSPAQEGILFHSFDADGVYVMQLSCMFRNLNTTALERAWEAVVARHAILRTGFVWENVARPQQVVRREVELPWTTFDWRDLQPAEQQKRFESYLTEEQTRRFDLSRAPVMRLGLIQVSDDAFRFVWTFHHILLDGWAIFLLLQDLFRYYETVASGEEIQLEPTLPYRDYIDWLEQQDPAPAETFWRELLQGFREPASMRLSAGKASERAAGVDEQRVVLSPELLTQLQSVARQHHLTLNTLFQGVWALILSHYSGKKDVVFGVTGSGRPPELPGIESMVGIFLNVLPMRARLSPDRSLWSWLNEIQEQQVESRQYDHSRLVQVQRLSEVPRGLPLFESILSFENYPIDNSLNDYTRTLALDDVRAFSQTNYPLTLICAPRGRYGLRLVYDRRRFEEQAIAQVLEMFTSLLRNLAENPEAHLSTMEDIMAQTEQQQRQLEQQKNEAAKRNKFKAIKPRAVSLPRELVKTSTIAERVLVIEPAVENVNVVNWAANQRTFLEAELFKYGAVLLRGFNVGSVQSFEEVAAAISQDLFGEYGDLPREDVGGKVYGSTPYPADKPILFHNESSHLPRWPMKIFFHCVQAAIQGGETPIVDCRQIYQRLPAAIRDRFESRKLMYVRNYIEGLDVSWQSFFKTSERAVVEESCRQGGMTCEWLPGNTLRTRQICQAVARHTKTGEAVFFNQLQLHHVSRLELEVRETLLSMYGPEELPRNVYYGDGTPIEDSLVEEICQLYWASSVAFPWHAGDVLMLDNMLTAHGRNPYVGARRIVVAMAQMHAAKDNSGHKEAHKTQVNAG